MGDGLVLEKNGMTMEAPNKRLPPFLGATRQSHEASQAITHAVQIYSDEGADAAAGLRLILGEALQAIKRIERGFGRQLVGIDLSKRFDDGRRLG